MESRCTVTEGVHLIPQLGSAGGDLPKDSVNQKEGKPIICSPLPQCVQYSLFESHQEEIKVECLSLGPEMDRSNAINSQTGNINE